MKQKCSIRRVIDGDTLTVDVAVPTLPGLNLWAHDLRCRLARIDAPEMKTPEGVLSRNRLCEISAQAGDTFYVELLRADKYANRWDVELWANEKVNVNDLMVVGGFAKPYLSMGDPDMHDLYPYPSTMPQGWIADLLAMFKDPSSIVPAEAAHFAWHVGGVALSTLLPGATGFEALSKLPEATATTAEAAAVKLEEMQGGGFSGAGDMKALPWNLILPILLALLKKWIGV